MNRTQALDFIKAKYDEWPLVLPIREPNHVTGGWARTVGEVVFRLSGDELNTITQTDWKAHQIVKPLRDPNYWSREKVLKDMVEDLKKWPEDIIEPTIADARRRIALANSGWQWIQTLSDGVVLADITDTLLDVERCDWEHAVCEVIEDQPKQQATQAPDEQTMTRECAIVWLGVNHKEWPTSDYAIECEYPFRGWTWAALHGDVVVFQRNTQRGVPLSTFDIIYFEDVFPQVPYTPSLVQQAGRAKRTLSRDDMLAFLVDEYDEWPRTISGVRNEIYRRESTNQISPVSSGWQWERVGDGLIVTKINDPLNTISRTDWFLACEGVITESVDNSQAPPAMDQATIDALLAPNPNIKIYSGAPGDEDRELLAEGGITTPKEETAEINGLLGGGFKHINPIMDFFKYDHLPDKVRDVSAELCDLAFKLDVHIPDGPEKSAGLRKLLEAKDCFVRAAL